MNLGARLPQCFLKSFHVVCGVVIGATFTLAAVGAQADSIKTGSTGAIRAVLAGAVDIGISARPVTAEGHAVVQ